LRRPQAFARLASLTAHSSRSKKHAREEERRQEERSHLTLSTQLEKARETVQLALYRTDKLFAAQAPATLELSRGLKKREKDLE